MTGTLVNVAAICTGALIGIALKKGIPSAVKNTAMQGMGLAILLIGIKMSLQGSNLLIIIISLAVGGICGELFKIELRLERAGQRLEKAVGGSGGSIAGAFVTTSLIYCVGAMAVVGSIEDGLTGNTDTLFAKSLIDGVSAIFFASTMGIGVAFSSLPVFLYQGTITMLAQFLKDILNPFVISQLTSTGGLLIIGVALNILEITRIKTGNLLPAIVLVVPLALIGQKLV